MITLTTDFGSGSSYVAQMKGVVWQRAPGCRIVDISHEIGPQRIAEAGRLLQDVVTSFPAGTIHVAVVDPGVGSSRRIVAACGGGQFLVGPDNGILSWATRRFRDTQWIVLDQPRYWCEPVAATFHGRDIMAPVAAHLALGVPFQQLGHSIDDPVLLSVPGLRFFADRVVGQIVHVDGFGNLITNISQSEFGSHFGVGRPGGVEAGAYAWPRVHRTYADGLPGESLCLFGSLGNLELAVRNGNAMRELQLAEGDPVTLFVAAGERHEE